MKSTFKSQSLQNFCTGQGMAELHKQFWVKAMKTKNKSNHVSSIY